MRADQSAHVIEGQQVLTSQGLPVLHAGALQRLQPDDICA